jgi:hypothetical protein
MKISDDQYAIEYHADTATILCSGSLRLYGGNEYAAIIDLLNTAADQKPEKLFLDFRELKFLNSSGINVFYKFILRVRDLQATAIIVLGSEQVFWQPKLLINFQRLLPEVQVEWSGAPEDKGKKK